MAVAVTLTARRAVSSVLQHRQASEESDLPLGVVLVLPSPPFPPCPKQQSGLLLALMCVLTACCAVWSLSLMFHA